MKKLVSLAAVLVAATFISGPSFAKDFTGKKGLSSTTEQAPAKEAKVEKVSEPKEKKASPKFPEKGWHKGPYLTANVGMIQVTNDTHVVTGVKYDGTIDPEFGFTFGWDIADWIGPMLQINYSTSTSTVGDPNGGNNGGAAYPSNPGVTFPAGTFPVETARQHVIDISLFARATLPYFTRAGWQPNMVKIIPYAKLGGTGYAMYVNAPTAANKGGALGGGPAVGLGCEFFIWKGFFIAIDATEHFIIQKSFSRNITTNAGQQNFKILEGGMKPHFALNGLFGWHF